MQCLSPVSCLAIIWTMLTFHQLDPQCGHGSCFIKLCIFVQYQSISPVDFRATLTIGPSEANWQVLINYSHTSSRNSNINKTKQKHNRILCTSLRDILFMYILVIYSKVCRKRSVTTISQPFPHMARMHLWLYTKPQGIQHNHTVQPKDHSGYGLSQW